MTAVDRDDRPDVYEENGLWVFRASSAGHCLKNLIAIRLGVGTMDTPAWLEKAYAEGVENEPVILANLVREHGWTLQEDASQNEVELRIGSKVIVRGHVDAKGAHVEHGVRVIEAKALAKSSVEKWERKGWDAFPYYATQLSIYMEATGLPGLFAIGVKEQESREVKTVIPVLVDEPPVATRDIKVRLTKAAMARELPDTCDYQHYPCSTFFLHEEKAKTEAEVLTEMKDTVALNALSDEYLRGHNMQTNGKKMKERASKEMKELFERLGKMGEPVSTGAYEVTYVEEDVEGGTYTRKPYTKSFPRITDIRGAK